jgi:hypothetical protein
MNLFVEDLISAFDDDNLSPASSDPACKEKPADAGSNNADRRLDHTVFSLNIA